MAEAHEDRFMPDAGGAGETRPALPAVPEPARRLGRLWTVLILAVLLASGIGLGRLLGGGEPAAASVTSAPAPPVVVVTVPAAAPRSCLAALRHGDATVDLLVHGIRDRRLSEALKSYVTASKACRKEVPEK
jgi:hypothetical protein